MPTDESLKLLNSRLERLSPADLGKQVLKASKTWNVIVSGPFDQRSLLPGKVEIHRCGFMQDLLLEAEGCCLRSSRLAFGGCQSRVNDARLCQRSPDTEGGYHHCHACLV